MGNDVSRGVVSYPDGQEGQFHKVGVPEQTVADDTQLIPGDKTVTNTKGHDAERKENQPSRADVSTTISIPAVPDILHIDTCDGEYALIGDCEKEKDGGKSEKTVSKATIDTKHRGGQQAESPSEVVEELILPVSKQEVRCEIPGSSGTQDPNPEKHKDAVPSVSAERTVQKDDVGEDRVTTEGHSVSGQTRGKKRDNSILKMFKFSKRNKDKVADGVKVTGHVIKSKVASGELSLPSGGKGAGSGGSSVKAKVLSTGKAIYKSGVVQEVVSEIKASHGNKAKDTNSVDDKENEKKQSPSEDSRLSAVSVDTSKTAETCLTVSENGTKMSVGNSDINGASSDAIVKEQDATHDVPKVADISDAVQTPDFEKADAVQSPPTDEVQPDDQPKVKKKSWSFQLGSRKSNSETSSGQVGTVSMNPEGKSDSAAGKPKRNKFSFKRFTQDRTSDSVASDVTEKADTKPMKLKKIKAKKEKKEKMKKGQVVDGSPDNMDSRSDSFCYLAHSDGGYSTPRSRRSIVDDDLNLEPQTDAFDCVSLSSLSSQDGENVVSRDPKGGQTSDSRSHKTSLLSSAAQKSGTVSTTTTLDVRDLPLPSPPPASVSPTTLPNGCVDIENDVVYTMVQKDNKLKSDPDDHFVLQQKTPEAIENTFPEMQTEVIKPVVETPVEAMIQQDTESHGQKGEATISDNIGIFVDTLSPRKLSHRSGDQFDVKVIQYGNIVKPSGKGRERIVAEFDTQMNNGVVVPDVVDHVHDDSDAYVQLEELVREFKDVEKSEPADISNQEGNMLGHRKCTGNCGKVLILKDVGVQVPDVHTSADVSTPTTSINSKEYVTIGVQFPDEKSPAHLGKTGTTSCTVDIPVAYF